MEAEGVRREIEGWEAWREPPGFGIRDTVSSEERGKRTPVSVESEALWRGRSGRKTSVVEEALVELRPRRLAAQL